jgi:two-component system KDP operon response regulator KdpE
MTELRGLKVLVVDDERPIRRFLRQVLAAHGMDVLEADTGGAGLAAVAAGRPDVVILDLGLPDMEGTEVMRRLRDYVTKPFGTGELLARLRAVLRRTPAGTVEPVFHSGDLMVDLPGRRVKVGEKPVVLTPNEFDLLRLFVIHAGKVFTHRQILVKVWGPGYADDAHLLRVNISNLRRKIEADPVRPRHIVTEAGVGYRLQLEEE